MRGWGPTTNSARTSTPHTQPAVSLSNLEQYLAESVVNFTGGQEPTQSPPVKEERYKCSQCGKTYKHAGSLTNHSRATLWVSTLVPSASRSSLISWL